MVAKFVTWMKSLFDKAAEAQQAAAQYEESCCYSNDVVLCW